MGLKDFVTSFRDMRQRNQQAYTIEQRSAVALAVNPSLVGKPQWLPHNLRSYDQAGYKKVALVFRCAQYLANAAGAAPLKVIDPKGKEIDDHPLLSLLDRPNFGMGGQRFRSFIALTAAIAGYCVIEKERDRAGRVIGLWPLRPDRLQPVLRNDGLTDWEYRVPGHLTPYRLAAEDAVTLTFADTLDGSPLGIGPLEVILEEVQISSALTDFLKVFMDRGALPLYVMIPSDDPQVADQWRDQETVSIWKEMWNQHYGGLGSATDPMPMVGMKDIKPLGLNFNELAYPELNNLTDARICEAFGIQPILVGAQVGLERSTFSNSAEARTSFYEDTMTYLWARIDDAITRQLLPDFELDPGWEIEFDTSRIPALQDNENERWERTSVAFQNGEISRHMSQRLKGIDVHGPDVFLQGFNLLEIPNTTATTSRRSRARIVDTTAPLRALPEPPFERRDGRLYRNERALTPAQREQRSRVEDTTKRQIKLLADLLGPEVSTFLQGQRDRVQAGISGRGEDAAPELRLVYLNPDWLQEDDLLRQVFAVWWEELQAVALRQAEALLGTEITWTVTNPYITDLQGVLARSIVGINETTRKAIEEIVKAEMLEGTSPAKLGDAIRHLFDETFRNRHLTIAATESMVAFGEASQLAYEASGVVQEVEILDNSEHTEEYAGAADGLTCAQRNNLIVPLERGSYHIRSDHPNGSACMLPVIAPLGGDGE